MSLLNKLTLKNLRLNKKRTIVTVIGIILSVALITAVATIYMSGLNSLIIYEKSIKGNYYVAYYDVPVDDVINIESNKGVGEVFLTKGIGYARLNESQNKNKPYAYVMGFDSKSLENLSIVLLDGRLPKNDHEIVIPSTLESNGRIKYNIGDIITLEVGKRMSEGYEMNQDNPFDDESLIPEEIVDTKQITYTIVGVIKRPATNVEPYWAPGYTFVTYLDRDIMEDNVNVYTLYNKEGGKNYITVTANILGLDPKIFTKFSNGDFTEEDRDKIFEEMEKARYQINSNDYLILLENDPIRNSGLGDLQYVVYIVCGIIVFTSVFCIKNSFDISITEKTKQYGMLRSVGATKKQISKNVLYEAFILGLIGIPLGLLLGNIASYILVLITNYLLADNFSEGLSLHMTFSWIAYLFASILGIITIYLSAIRSSIKAGRISPIDSIRNSASIKIKAKKLKTPKLVSKLFGIGGEISYKNIKRNKKKYRVTVLSIIVSVAVFVSLSYFMSTFMREVNDEISYNDYNIVYEMRVNDSDITKLNMINETTNLDNIKEYSIQRYSNMTITDPSYNSEYRKFIAEREDDKFLTILAVGEKEYKKYVKECGFDYDYIKDKGILIDTFEFSVLDEHKKDVKHKERVLSYKNGDQINGIYEEQVNADSHNISITVGGVTENKPIGLKNRDDEKFLIVSDEYYNNNIQGNLFYTVYFDSSNANKLQDDIDNILKGEDYTLNNSEENTKTLKNVVLLIGIFLYGFIAVITLIGVTNIFNTITTNMELRKPEFAMLKSVGMTKGEFNRMIRLETVFICVKSLFFGLPIGLLLSFGIYKALDDVNGFIPPFKGILISVVFVFLLISILMRYSIGKINKQNTIETIRNENI